MFGRVFWRRDLEMKFGSRGERFRNLKKKKVVGTRGGVSWSEGEEGWKRRNSLPGVAPDSPE